MHDVIAHGLSALVALPSSGRLKALKTAPFAAQFQLALLSTVPEPWPIQKQRTP
jgi:hypothetical protein